MDLNSVDFLDSIAFPAKGIRATMIQNARAGWIGNEGSSRELSNETDLQWLLAHRNVADAVLVGSDTALRENYKKPNPSREIIEWREGHNLKPKPLLITTTNNSAKLAELLEISDLVVVPNAVAGDKSDSNLVTAGEISIDWKVAIEKLNELGIIRINCEGGPKLIDLLLQNGLINQFSLTRSPVDGPSEKFTHINEFLKSNSAEIIHQANDFSFVHVGQLPTWESLLSVGEYFVLRDAGTQAPFSVDYEKKPAAGYYTCRSCGARLFDATDQFDARCGWPAFWKPTDNANLILEDDFSKGYVRVEVKCGTCESHLGHVFHGEGFGFPTDDRYCINAICLVRKFD